jgi:hypothetical protein
MRTLILPFCEFFVAGKLHEIELNLAVPDDDGSDHQLGHAALHFIQPLKSQHLRRWSCLESHRASTNAPSLSIQHPPSSCGLLSGFTTMFMNARG